MPTVMAVFYAYRCNMALLGSSRTHVRTAAGDRWPHRHCPPCALLLMAGHCISSTKSTHMDLENLGRKELQALAKQYGLKANAATAVLVQQLGQILLKDFVAQEDTFLNAEEVETEKAIEKRISLLPEPIEVVDNVLLNTISEADIGPFTTGPVEVETNDVTAFSIGDTIEVEVDGSWQMATIKRINKLTYRVELSDSHHDLTIKMTQARRYVAATVDEVNEDVEEEFHDAPVEEDVAVVEIVSHPVDGTEVPSHEHSIMNSVVDESAQEDEEEFSMAVEPHELETVQECEEEEEDDTELEFHETVDQLLTDMQPIMEEDENDDDDLLLSTVCMPTPTATHKRKHIVDDRSMLDSKTPKKTRTSEILPWNSASKRDTLSSTLSATKKDPLSARKSYTPRLSQNPVIVPKINASLKLRMEALKKKSETPSGAMQQILPGLKTTPKLTPVAAKIASVSAQRSEVPKVSSAAKRTSVVMSASKLQMTPTAASAVSAAPTSNQHASTVAAVAAVTSAKKTSTPDFKKLHQKQFNMSRPLTAVVQRNKDIAKKMDEAFAAATGEVDKPVGTAKTTSSRPSLVSRQSVAPTGFRNTAKNLETKKTSFLSQSSSSSGIENSNNNNNASTFVSSTAKIVHRVSAKDVSASKMASKNASRKEVFVASATVKREEAIKSKRRSVIEPVAANPFGDIAL